MDPDDLVVVRTFGDRFLAAVAKTALDAAGIQCFLRSDDAGGLRPAMAFSQGVELVVRAADLPRADELLSTSSNPPE